MNKILVSLKENSYPVIIGENILAKIPELTVKYNLNKNILVIIDKNVYSFHKKKIQLVLRNISGKINYYILKPGENSKSYQELNKIYSYLLKNNYGRDSLVISVGGGVTGDLTAFAAATYMRGIQVVHVPTTLLAAVDSSIGGKTGINFENKKNMIGSFYQPKFVLSDTEFLKTLPKIEITSGLGEIIKYAFLSDKDFFNFVNKNFEDLSNLKSRVLLNSIIGSVKIKAGIVSQDEKESGLRKILNLGHTFAHAFETELKFAVKHGEAVTAGVICALLLSNRLGFISDGTLDTYIELPLKINLSSKFIGLDKNNLYKIMQHDKKNRNGKIKFVLISEIGKLLLDVEAGKKELFYIFNEMERRIS